jgi:hypothetical protein
MSEAAPELTEEELLSTYLPSTDDVEFDLPVRGKMRFKALGGTKGQKKLQEKIERWLTSTADPSKPAYKSFADVLPGLDTEDVAFSLEIHYRAVSPQISQRGALLMHGNPDLVALIRKKLGRADKDMLAMYYQAREEEAEKKSQIPGSDDASGSAEGSSPDVTPTT